jgi:peptidoglycan/LPS O-acetylase OafA/YrhL
MTKLAGNRFRRRNPGRILQGRILNSLPFVLLGRWSYSLYLWQQVFLLEPRATKPYAYFPLNLVLALLASIGSYYLLEQPLIRYGRILLNRVKYHRSHVFNL